MGSSFFLLLFISLTAIAQVDTGTGVDGACTEAVPGFANGGTFNCQTLSINGAVNFNPNAAALIIKVRGNVTIADTINLSGDNGTNVASFAGGNNGGEGGPDAGDGGGDDGAGTLLNGEDASTASGQAAGGGDPDCGDGGGGGGFSVNGSAGTVCTAGNGGAGVGPASTTVPSSQFNLPTLLRGGFGGGAGGDSAGLVYGTGGGGGGFMRITAGGNVTITALGNIFAAGGDGGPGGPDGGGGGGGSGGVIWIQALGNITHDGDMHADGGNGGTAASNGVGGDGGNGVVRLEDLDGIIAGGGTLPAYVEQVKVSSGGSNSLNSSIACGMLGKDDDNNSQFFQMILGFSLIVALLHFMRKFKILFPRLR